MYFRVHMNHILKIKKGQRTNMYRFWFLAVAKNFMQQAKQLNGRLGWSKNYAVNENGFGLDARALMLRDVEELADAAKVTGFQKVSNGKNCLRQNVRRNRTVKLLSKSLDKNHESFYSSMRLFHQAAEGSRIGGASKIINVEVNPDKY